MQVGQIFTFIFLYSNCLKYASMKIKGKRKEMRGNQLEKQQLYKYKERERKGQGVRKREKRCN